MLAMDFIGFQAGLPILQNDRGGYTQSLFAGRLT